MNPTSYDDAGGDAASAPPVLPVDPAVMSMLDAVTAEGRALDQLLMRARALLLLQTAGQFDHLERAVRDLDGASSALGVASQTRSAAVAAAVGDVLDRHQLVERCPASVAPVLAAQLASQQQTLAEVTEINEAIVRGANVAAESLRRRRRNLEHASNGGVTYVAP